MDGFQGLQSNDGRVRKFTIMHITQVDSAYPRAHTCFNRCEHVLQLRAPFASLVSVRRIDLPAYSSRQELENCLELVINMEVTGFSMN